MRLTGIVLVVSIMWACHPEKAPQNVMAKSNADSVPATEPERSLPDTTNPDTSGVAREWQEFDAIFTYSDADVTQRLGVTWLTTDSIEFRLLTEDNLCDTQYWGEARNMYPDGDPEIDEDENSESYPASEFTFENDHHALGIRIADTKDKARITFADKTNTDTDCIPSPGLLLKRTEDMR